MRKGSHLVDHQTTGYKQPIALGCSTRQAQAPTAAVHHMKEPPVDPDVADVAPNETALTAYDEQHIVTYIRLLQAQGEGADWREVARIVLHIDPEREPDRARNADQSHLARAKWMTEQGRLLRGTGLRS